MPITLRYTKGAPLTHDELDTNFTHFFYDVAVTGSLVRFYRQQYDNTDSNPNASVTFPVNPPAGQDKHIQVKYGNALSGSEAIFTSSANYTFDYETNQVLITGSQNILGNQSVVGDIAVTGDIEVSGTVTAREFKTELVSSSIIFREGSTKFGDTTDDLHQFTGSLGITSNTEIKGTLTLGSITDVETELGNLDTSITALSSSASTDRINKFNTLNSNITALSSSASTERTEHSSSLASSITSLSSSVASTYLKNTTDTLTGDLTVTGTITAQEFNTEYITSSVIFESGSTKFGNSADDQHTFTGSVDIDGRLGITGFTDVSASLAAAVAGTGIQNIAEDTTPQLGGNLDLNSNDISGSGTINIGGGITSSGLLTVTGTGTSQFSSHLQAHCLGIGTAPSGTTGEIRAAGDITAYYSSDKRLKDNITPISDAINKLNQIGGYEFDWNSNSSHSGHDVGVIAQEIEKVLPEVVTTRDNGYMAVRYEKIVALLIQAVKEQQLQIDELKSKL